MRFFYKLTRSTLIAVYVLILVGGIVRSTGSGMGCPDWPKCFGSWIPPTSVSQLPENYKEIYSNFRQAKNERFAKYLAVFGFHETAEKMLADKSIREEADFNPVKTWIEYVNRIIGVIIGILIFAVFGYSIRYWSTYRKITVISFFTFCLVGFQGWIGSIVVSTNLTPWTITIHMFLAIGIVSLLIYILFLERNFEEVSNIQVPQSLQIALLAGLLVLVVQILLGTQVREAIDRVAGVLADRNQWISELGMDFIVHRSFSWLVFFIHGYLIYKIWQVEGLKGFSLGIILLILGTLLTGVGMAWFGVPPYLQPTHLALATVTFGVEFFLLLIVNNRRKMELKQ